MSTRKHVADHTHTADEIIGTINSSLTSDGSGVGYNGFGMLEIRGQHEEIGLAEMVNYIWGYENGIWLPVSQTIPQGVSYIRFKDEPSGNYLDLFMITLDDGGLHLGTSQGMIIKKDLAVGGFVSANQGLIALGSGMYSPFDPSGIWLIHSGKKALDSIETLGSAPASPVEGRYYVNSGNNHIYYYNGVSWDDCGSKDNCDFYFDTCFVRKSGYTTPKPPFATANIPIPVNELGNLACNTLYVDSIKKADGSEIFNEFNYITITDGSHESSIGVNNVGAVYFIEVTDLPWTFDELLTCGDGSDGIKVDGNSTLLGDVTIDKVSPTLNLDCDGYTNFFLRSFTDNKLYFSKTGTNLMSLDSNGNLTLLVASPNGTLYVTGSASIQTDLGVSGVLNIAKLTISASYGTSGQVLTSQGSGNAPAWTTPTALNAYAQALDQYLNTTGYDVKFDSVTGTNGLKLGTWGSQEFAITQDATYVYLNVTANKHIYLGSNSGYKVYVQRNLEIGGNLVYNNTTLVSNLNADLLDGHHWSEIPAATWTAPNVSAVDSPLSVSSGHLILTQSLLSLTHTQISDWATATSTFVTNSYAAALNQGLTTTGYDVRFDSITGTNSIKLGTWGSQEFAITQDATYVYLNVTANKHLYLGSQSGYKIYVQRNLDVAGVLNIAKLTVASAYGTSGQVLTSQGSGNAPIWSTPSGGNWTAAAVSAVDSPLSISSGHLLISATPTFTGIYGTGGTLNLYHDTNALATFNISRTSADPTMNFLYNSGNKGFISYVSSIDEFVLQSSATNITLSNQYGNVNLYSTYVNTWGQIRPASPDSGQVGTSGLYYFAIYSDYFYGKNNGTFGCERSKSGQEWPHEFSTPTDALDFLTHELTKTKYHITYDLSDPKEEKIICTCGKSTVNPCREHMNAWADKYSVNTGKITQACGFMVLQNNAEIVALQTKVAELEEKLALLQGVKAA